VFTYNNDILRLRQPDLQTRKITRCGFALHQLCRWSKRIYSSPQESTGTFDASAVSRFLTSHLNTRDISAHPAAIIFTQSNLPLFYTTVLPPSYTALLESAEQPFPTMSLPSSSIIPAHTISCKVRVSEMGLTGSGNLASVVGAGGGDID